mgnify:CR=1 FL=1
MHFRCLIWPLLPHVIKRKSSIVSLSNDYKGKMKIHELVFFFFFSRWNNREKSKIRKLFGYGFAAHIVLNFIFTIFLLNVAKANYPGGVAIARIHRLASSNENVTLHIDNLSAQTGVSRFTQIYSNWR